LKEHEEQGKKGEQGKKTLVHSTRVVTARALVPEVPPRLLSLWEDGSAVAALVSTRSARQWAVECRRTKRPSSEVFRTSSTDGRAGPLIVSRSSPTAFSRSRRMCAPKRGKMGSRLMVNVGLQKRLSGVDRHWSFGAPFLLAALDTCWMYRQRSTGCAYVVHLVATTPERKKN